VRSGAPVGAGEKRAHQHKARKAPKQTASMRHHRGGAVRGACGRGGKARAPPQGAKSAKANGVDGAPQRGCGQGRLWVWGKTGAQRPRAGSERQYKRLCRERENGSLTGSRQWTELNTLAEHGQRSRFTQRWRRRQGREGRATQRTAWGEQQSVLQSTTGNRHERSAHRLAASDERNVVEAVDSGS